MVSGVLGGASDLGEPSDKGRAPALGDTSDWRAAPVQERPRHTHEVPLHTCQQPSIAACTACVMHRQQAASHFSNAHSLRSAQR